MLVHNIYWSALCIFSPCTQDGQIDAEELQRCLTSSGIGGSYQPFSKETCRIMITMLDRDYSGKMGFAEFKELWGALNQWKVWCAYMPVCVHVLDTEECSKLCVHRLFTKQSMSNKN